MSSGAWGRGIGEADEREVGSVSEGRGAPGQVIYGRGGRIGVGQLLNLLGQALGWVLADARKKIIILLRGTTIFVSWVGGMLWFGRSLGRVGTSTLAGRGTVVRTLVGAGPPLLTGTPTLPL